jgi:putative flippase GtrA
MKVPRKLAVQFLKYLVGGGVWFVSGYIVFSVCYGLWGWSWWTAKLLADVIGWALNYVIQRYWAFQNPALNGHEVRISFRYLLLLGLNVVIDFAIVGGLKHVGVSPFIGLFVAASFFTLWNFLWYRLWIFKASRNA